MAQITEFQRTTQSAPRLPQSRRVLESLFNDCREVIQHYHTTKHHFAKSAALFCEAVSSGERPSRSLQLRQELFRKEDAEFVIKTPPVKPLPSTLIRCVLSKYTFGLFDCSRKLFQYLGCATGRPPYIN